MKDPKMAFTMLHKGISVNKDSTLLYNEVIKLEIHQAVGADTLTKLEETEELKEKQQTCLQTLKAYFKAIYKNIKDSLFYCELLSFFDDYKFTLELQNEIIKELLQNHYENPEMWDYLAKRAYEGKSDQTQNTAPQRIKSSVCFEKYKEGLQKVPKDAKQRLWNMCINYFIEITLQEFATGNVSKTKTLLEAFQAASNDGYLAEEHYISWIDHVDQNKYEIARKGTEQYPQSIDLWRQRFYLKQEILFDSPDADEKMHRLFRLGIDALKDNSLTLWNCMLRYCLINSNNEVIENVYKEGCKQSGNIGNDFKPRYITWLNVTKGISAAREAYNTMARTRPYSKEIHEAMWRAESTEIKFDYNAWQEVHKLASEQFGTVDVDVWIDYLRFHMLYDQTHDVKVAVENIVDKALKILQEHLHLEFRDKYMQLQNLIRNETQ